MTMNESAENYLETILVLSHSLPVVRSVDIANEMGFKKSSVSVAMKNLRENGYILVSDSGFITLTDSGMEIAEMIYERHTLLSTWLETLGVDKEIALRMHARWNMSSVKKVLTQLNAPSVRMWRSFFTSSFFLKYQITYCKKDDPVNGCQWNGITDRC